MDPINPYDGTTSYTEIDNTTHPNQDFNLYGHDAGGGGAGGPTLYSQHDAYAQPVSLSMRCEAHVTELLAA